MAQIPFLDAAGFAGTNITAPAAVVASSAVEGWLHELSLSFFRMRLFGIVNQACALVLAALAGAPVVTQAASVSLPSYPLAVKHPYLSAWLPGNQASNVATSQPQFWAGQSLNWPVLARINGQTYSLFGVSNAVSGIKAATTQSVSYTSSHTYFQLQAGSAKITLDFFSPVLPGAQDYARQSLPYSYLTVSVASTSGRTLSVQVLSGIDQTWTAQNGASKLNFTSSGSAGYFQFHNPNEVKFTEVNDMATYGTVVFAASTGAGLSSACGAASAIYSYFAKNGALSTSRNCSGSDLAAFASNLGKVSGSAKNFTFAVGFDRTDAIDYLGQTQMGYYRSQWPTIGAAVQYFLRDYSNVLASSIAFDNEIRSKSEGVSAKFGSQYADIVEASVRQTFGALELTVPASDLSATPSVFLKEISSDGNVNTIDLIFQSWPIFVNLNPEYIRFLLEPVLSYSNLPPSQGWPQPWVIHDIGTHYPNATGHNDGQAEQMPLFETSSLFIMLQVYRKYTGDSSYIQKYLPLLEKYAEYLVPNSLYPASQLISVDAIPATANQTGLAVQSVIGLKAAAAVLGNSTYSDIAASYAKTIYNDGLGLDGPDPAHSHHFTYNYGLDATWNVLFPAYSDVLLGLETFPSSAWQLQSDWYISQIQELGLPFAGPLNETKYIGEPLRWGLSDWNIVAAGASSEAVQAAVVNTTHTFLTNGLNTIPFGTKYYVEGADVGEWIGNKARSTVGSDFALLALKYGTFGSSY